MSMLIRVLITEYAKLRRTLALWMAFLAPFVVALLYFLIGHFGADKLIASQRDYARDLSLNSIMMWTILMMPLFITLETSLLAGIEHADRNWKSLLALPAPRWTVYLSKLIVALTLVWLAHAVLVVLDIVSGNILAWLHPAMMPHGLPLRPLVVPMAKVSAGVLLAFVIQHWVSLRWQSFPASLGFGMSVMVVGFVALNSNDWGPYVPWSMPMHLLRSTRSDLALRLAVSGGLAAVIAVLGCVEFSRRDVHS